MCKSIIPLLLVATLLFACNKSNENNKQSQLETDTPYSFVNDSTYVGFVAYKFSEKAGVPGWFTSYKVDGIPSTFNSAEELLQNLTFEIPVSSLETGIDDRNAKIREHFFGTIETERISGRVVHAKDGIAEVELQLNSINKTVPLDYELNNSRFKLSGTIDVTLWDAISGIDALNKACDILHKGADGVSKLWSTVDLEITTTLVKN